MSGWECKVYFITRRQVCWRSQVGKHRPDSVDRPVSVTKGLGDLTRTGACPTPAYFIWCRLFSSVITSYSIHYTKLYERATVTWGIKGISSNLCACKHSFKSFAIASCKSINVWQNSTASHKTVFCRRFWNWLIPFNLNSKELFLLESYNYV